MDIRSSLDGLKTLLGVTSGAPASTQRSRGGQAVEANTLTSDRATVSNAGNEVAHAAAEGGVRTEKVAEIKAALASGAYNVPASAVASRMVDAMLGRGQ